MAHNRQAQYRTRSWTGFPHKNEMHGVEVDFEIYTDGSSKFNPNGSGGWAAIVLQNGKIIDVTCGSSPHASNNQMEIMAAIGGLSKVPVRATVRLYSDSAYLCNAIEKGWLENWKSNGWRTASGSAVANKDLWQTLDDLLAVRDVEFRHIKGHQGIRYNELADKLAKLSASIYELDSDGMALLDEGGEPVVDQQALNRVTALVRDLRSGKLP